jgi:hypothetical protein
MQRQNMLHVFGAVLTLSATAAIAHHGWGGNNQAVEISGTVVAPVDLSGPHGTLQIRDASGQVWDLTLAPAPRTQRAGLGADTLAVGDQITATGMRNDNPERLEVKTARVTRGETHYDVYPEQAAEILATLAAGRD